MGGVPAKKYRIMLSVDERKTLQAIASSKKIAAGKVTKAKALLLCDESELGKALSDSDLFQATQLSASSLERLRKRCCEVGPLEALERKVREVGPRIKKFGGYEQAQLVQIACSDAPEGCARWTLALLADKLVEMNVVDSVSRETIRRELKKTNSNLG